MFWPFRRSNIRIEERTQPVLEFVGEQDGPSERDLKSEFLPILKSSRNVKRAYLARAKYSESDSSEVVLAIRSIGPSDQGLVRALCEVFSRLFRTDTHLDVMFLSTEQEIEVKRVCQPFYKVSGLE